MKLAVAPKLRETIRNGKYGMQLRGKRLGVMLHYDASTSDEGAVGWFKNPKCEVSYQYLVLDDGSYVEIANHLERAWHAGVCRSSNEDKLRYSDANSAFIGIAVATDDAQSVTAPQLLTAAWLTAREFHRHGWSLAETWRIVGHNTEAWPRGRKIDPEGDNPKLPTMRVSDVRWLVERMAL